MGDSLNLTNSTHTINIANLVAPETLCTPLDRCKTSLNGWSNKVSEKLKYGLAQY